MMMILRVPWLSTPARTTMKTTSPPSTLAAATASLRSQAPLWRPTLPQWRVAEAAASLALLSAATQTINCVLWDILSLTNPLYSCVLSFGFKSWINLALVTPYCFLLFNYQHLFFSHKVRINCHKWQQNSFANENDFTHFTNKKAFVPWITFKVT